MTAHTPIDGARLALLLTELRLPTIKACWSGFTEQADREGWPGARLLATLAEQEVADRARRRIERHLNEAHLPAGKSLDNFDFNTVPMVSKAQVMALCAGGRGRQPDPLRPARGWQEPSRCRHRSGTR